MLATTESGYHAMKAKLKEMYSLELALPLESFWPEDANNFGLSVRLMIGVEDSPGAEAFDIVVCTPDWIQSQYADEKCVWGNYMLIVLEYDFSLIRKQIEDYIASCVGEDWLAIARKLSRIAAWEFDTYQPR